MAGIGSLHRIGVVGRVSAFAAALLIGFLLFASNAEAGPTGTQPQISPASAATVVHIGDTLTEVPATWSALTQPATTQWFDCNGSGASCTPIAGTALGAPGSSYTVTSSDVGSTIEVQETGTDLTGPTTVSSPPTAVVPPPPPANSGAPTVSGTAQQGQTLIAGTGVWSPTPTSYTYQWLSCNSLGGSCGAIGGATNPTYVPTANDVGGTVKVQVVASDAGGPGAAANSAPTAVVTPAAPVNKFPPTILGVAAEGQTLFVSNGSWANSPDSFTYQWYRCDSTGTSCVLPIAGATAQTYALTVADVGLRVDVQVTAVNAGGSSLPSASAPTTAPTAVNGSSVSLLALPAGPVTGQAVTLVATVTATSGSTPPGGTVTFEDGGAPIGGCENVPVATFSMSVNVTCQTTFSAARSPVALTAVFNSTPASGIAGSSSQPLSVGVGRTGTTTALDVSNPTISTGSSATYTATVSPASAGPFVPSGSVQFTQDGRVIGACANQSLTGGAGVAVATCSVRYVKASRHSVTVVYGGDGAFLGSSSAPVTVSVHSLPARVTGTITAKMHWVFAYTPKYTRVLAMIIHQALAGTTVTILCHGHGCPLARRSASVAQKCSGTSHNRCHSSQLRTVNLLAPLRHHRLQVGTVLTVKLSRPHFIGKQYVFSIRSGRAPGVKILCVAPGAKRAGVGC